MSLKLRQKSVNQIFNPIAFFFFLLTGDKDITMLYTQFLHILHHLKAMKMTSLELFLICMFKDPKVAKKMDQFGGKSNKKLNTVAFMEFVFSKSDKHSCP